MAAKFLAGENVWFEIHESVRRSKRGERFVAVAYLGWGTHDERLPLGRGDLLVVDCSLAIAKGGQTDPREVRKFVDAGVKVFRRDNLHAKVYVLGDTAIVGSANASRSSERALCEAVVVTSDPGVVASARRFVKSLAAGQRPIDDAWLTACEEVFEPRAASSSALTGGVDTVSEPPADSQLWLAATGTAQLKKAGTFYCGDQRVLCSSRMSLRAAERVTARKKVAGCYSVSMQYNRRPPFAEGDLVIQCNYPPEGVGGHTLAYPPALVESISQRPEGAWVVSLQRPIDEKSLRTADFRKECTAVALVVPDFGDAPQMVSEPRKRRALLALWGRR